MKEKHHILGRLRAKGHRLTLVRESVIELLVSEAHPLAVKDIMSGLQSMGITVNKTTVYRELDFLVSESMAVEVNFSDRKKRYELASRDHHHHIICTNCDRVEDVVLEHELHHEEKRIENETKFRVLNHALEFFGLCMNCK